MNRIAVTGAFGTYSARTDTVDLMMTRYLPASPASLRTVLVERAGGELDYTYVTDVTTALVILADFFEAESRLMSYYVTENGTVKHGPADHASAADFAQSIRAVRPLAVVNIVDAAEWDRRTGH